MPKFAANLTMMFNEVPLSGLTPDWPMPRSIQLAGEF
jgi:hypothetical protein